MAWRRTGRAVSAAGVAGVSPAGWENSRGLRRAGCRRKAGSKVEGEAWTPLSTLQAVNPPAGCMGPHGPPSHLNTLQLLSEISFDLRVMQSRALRAVRCRHSTQYFAPAAAPL